MKEEILEKLANAVIEFDSEAAVNWAKKAIEEGVEPLDALNALTKGIREVGEGFSKGDYFLPELVGAADAMQSAVPILEEEINPEIAAVGL